MIKVVTNKKSITKEEEANEPDHTKKRIKYDNKYAGQGKKWRTGKSKYNWAVKFKKGYFELVRGKDYHVQTIGMCTTIRTMAAKHNKGVSIRVAEQGSKKGVTKTIIKVTVHPLPIRKTRPKQHTEVET